jgi:hypothetical protein
MLTLNSNAKHGYCNLLVIVISEEITLSYFLLYLLKYSAYLIFLCKAIYKTLLLLLLLNNISEVITLSD